MIKQSKLIIISKKRNTSNSITYKAKWTLNIKIMAGNNNKELAQNIAHLIVKVPYNCFYFKTGKLTNVEAQM